MKALVSLALAFTTLVVAASGPVPAEMSSVLTVTNASSEYVHVSFHKLAPGLEYFGEMAAPGHKVVFNFPQGVSGIVYGAVKARGRNGPEKASDACTASLPITIKEGHTVNLRVVAENHTMLFGHHTNCAIDAN